MSERLGSSSKYIVIDMASTVPPFTFASVFAAAYPRSGRSSFVSRSIVAIDGPGTLTLKDAEGDSVAWPMQAYEVNDVVAVGVDAAVGISQIKVFL